jgi:hypothetical protein
MSSDAPSESVSFVILPRENIQFVLDNDAINVIPISHIWIVAEVSPVPINLYVTINGFKEVKWGRLKRILF